MAEHLPLVESFSSQMPLNTVTDPENYTDDDDDGRGGGRDFFHYQSPPEV